MPHPPDLSADEPSAGEPGADEPSAGEPGAAVPQHCPTPRELDDLELLVSGALAPLTAFDEPGSPVTLGLPGDVAAHGVVELVDPEGLPLARATRTEQGAWATTPLSHAEHGPFRRLHLAPAQVRERYAGRTVVPVTGPVTDVQLDQLASLGPVLLLALSGAGTPELSPVALLRATLRVAESLDDAAVVAVPLASHDDPEVDHELGVQVVRAYAGDDPVVGLVDEGEPLAELDDVLDFDQPPPEEQGLVLFFTGLSGSGKSTLARALTDRLLEQGARTVTSLDGDVVRRNLSAGLTFSAQDRETNIRRIGWVAAEISRHGGVAVCSPIAPFAETRRQVRAMVEGAGGAFFLVHVATPLEECERRDRKGLYAKARRGEITEFTGISSPYEEPDDADARVDTTGRSVPDVLEDLAEALAEVGYVDLRVPSGEPAEHSSLRGGRAGRPAGAERVETSPEDPSSGRGLDSPPSVPHGGGSTTCAPGAAPPLRVLFVCTANICRSPFLELLARHVVGDEPAAGVRFGSAGTHGFTDRPMDPVMAETLAARSVDAAGFRSRPLTRAMVEEADLVLTAEHAHRTFILDDQAHAFRKVLTLGQAAQAVTDLDGVAGRDLLEELGRRRPAGAESDVVDPHGRGAEAAEESARRLESLLRVVVPALVPSVRT